MNRNWTTLKNMWGSYSFQLLLMRPLKFMVTQLYYLLFTTDREDGRYNLMSDLDVLESVLDRFEGCGEDVVCFCNDSASYMKRLCEDLKSVNPEFKTFDLCYPCHLLDGAFKEGFKWSKHLQDVVDFVMHSGTLFKYARDLKRKYFAVCRSVRVEPKVIPCVTQSCWYSVILIEIWRPFITFLNSAEARNVNPGQWCEENHCFVS